MRILRAVKRRLVRLAANPIFIAPGSRAAIARAATFEQTSRMPEAVSELARVPDRLVRKLRPLSYCYRLLQSRENPDNLPALIEFTRRALAPEEQLTVSGYALAAGESEIARQLYDEAAATEQGRASGRVGWLQPWLSPQRMPTSRRESPVPRLAVFDYRHADRDLASINLGDWVQTIAVLGNIARNSIGFGGDAHLARFAARLQGRVEPHRVLRSRGDRLDLVSVQRDFSSMDEVESGTWLIAYGWFMWPRFGREFDFPFNPSLRPLFISFHCNTPELLTPEAEKYLRRYSPVGCRDWNTVDLLLSRGIPAFFSGCVTTTMGNIARRSLTAEQAQGLPLAFVDLNPDDAQSEVGIQSATMVDSDALGRDFASNLTVTLALLDSFRDSYRALATSRLHCYLPSRAMGTTVSFTPPDPDDIRFEGLKDVGDEDFRRMSEDVAEKLAAALGWIIDGDSEEAVYSKWRELCSPAVALAEARNAA